LVPTWVSKDLDVFDELFCFFTPERNLDRFGCSFSWGGEFENVGGVTLRNVFPGVELALLVVDSDLLGDDDGSELPV